MNQEEFNTIFRNRTKKLAIEIIKLTAELKYSDGLGIIRKQIIRSSTSVATNYRAVTRSRSERERFSKLCIVTEEADETLFWLEMLTEANYIEFQKIKTIYDEALEIVKVMSSFKKKLQPNP